MSGRNRSDRRRTRPRAKPGAARSVRVLLLALALPLWLVLGAAAASSQEPAPTTANSPSRSQPQAEGPWRGLDVPRYPNGDRFHIESDDDEYDIYFHSSDDVRAVFDYYRAFLEKQGFRVVRSTTRAQGMKADLVRGKGGPNDSIELDAKLEHGRYKVELEFDD